MSKLFLFILFIHSFLLYSQNIVINELCTRNSNIIADNDFNQFADWIELHNTESINIDLSGYYITDDTLIKTKWQFPSNTIVAANGFLLVWADDQDTVINEHHTNFKLSTKNECVALFDSDLNLIDIIEYPDQYRDISYGKAKSGNAFFASPTPASTNTTTPYYSDEREPSPSLQLPSGFYLINTTLVIEGIPIDSQVRYTLDGSYPNENSTIYSEPIVLTENTVVRARTYGSLLPSKEISCSYFIGTNKELPVVSLIINPDFLWSDSLGIFNDFEIDKRVLWERSSKIQYFENNALEFETNNEIRLFGNTAYLLPQKSIAVFADKKIEYQIFNGKELSVFDSFILRSSSDDWTKTMFRDGFVHTIVQEKLSIDYQAYQPTVLYINGEYFGIFNLREKYNEDFLENNHGINKDSLDLLKLNYLWGTDVEVLAGTSEKFSELLVYLNSNDMTNDVVFEGVKEFLDIKDYTNFIITQIYISNISYRHNIKTWRLNNIADGFKWLIYDTDRAYIDLWRRMFLLVYDADPVLKKLLENINYRNHFLQQTCSHINTTFREHYIFNLIDSLQNNIVSEMPFHIEKWAPFGGIQSMESWNSEVDVLNEFAKLRQDTLLYRLDSMYNLYGQVSVHLKKTNPQGGNIYIEDILIPYNDSVHTYFKGLPVKLIAKPKPGYDFIDWENISTNDSIVYIFSSDQTINARFQANCDIPQIISEDATLVKDCSPYYFDSDISVEAGATLFCEPGVEIYFGDNTQLTVLGSIEFIGTEENPIVIQSQPGEYWKYIRCEGGNIFIKHATIYSGKKAISFTAGGNLNVDNCTFYESDLDESDLISGNTTNVEFTNNVFYGNSENDKTDCIDCDGIQSGIFTGNIFYDVTDDCIDIGTNSSGVFIEQNQCYNCESMGISIGESSIAYIGKNIIANCNGGIQVHTDAMATIVNNTLYNNEIGIKCYHYNNTPNTGGSATVVNTIFSQSVLDYDLQSNSQIEIIYSLSDLALHLGQGNLFDNPYFVQPSNNDFYLLPESPCIDAGNIISTPDPDGTRADIGALFYNQSNSTLENEVNISISPNPFRNRFTIYLDDRSLIQDVEVYNLLGEKVYTRRGINNNSYQVEMESKGLLFIIVTDTKGNKLIKRLISI